MKKDRVSRNTNRNLAEMYEGAFILGAVISLVIGLFCVLIAFENPLGYLFLGIGFYSVVCAAVMKKAKEKYS